MENIVMELDVLLCWELLQYRKLLECLEQERQALISAELDIVRETSAQKESIAKDLIKSQKDLDCAWQKFFPDSDKSVSVSMLDKAAKPCLSEPIRKILLELSAVKDQVICLAETNKAIAKDSIGFLNDLFYMITAGEPGHTPSYGRNGQIRSQSGRNRFMDREV